MGAGTAAGAALLLYTGRGFLSTAGFLIAVSIAAVAGGLWVGAPDVSAARAVPSRARWAWAVIAFLVAGAFVLFWNSRPTLRSLAVGGALAVLFVLAEPAYAAGSLIAALDARSRTSRAFAGSAVAALLGGAAGVLLAATMLIPNFAAPGIYFGAAALLVITGTIESTRPARAGGKDGHSMRDAVVIITGVSDRGQVGYAVAERFLAAGARLVITGRSEAVHDAAAGLGEKGTVRAVQADLTSPIEAEHVVQAARDGFGRLDVVINCAGGLRVSKPVADTETEEWRGEVERNAETAFNVCRAALPLLRESHGAIVNFASPAGVRAVANMAAHSAAKAAVVALTRALALEERAHGVRVNAIAPGLIETEQNRRSTTNPERARWVRREDVAEVTLFLASAAAAAITGETIHVTG